MKTYRKQLAGLLVLLPSVLLAQVGQPALTDPLAPIFKEKIRDFKLIPSAVVQGPELSFRQQLPSIFLHNNKKSIVDSYLDPVYRYNLPVVKPGTNSKILVAKLDPNQPYTYRMPVKRNESADK